MLSTLFRNTETGIFVYLPDDKMKKGTEFSFHSFSYIYVEDNVEMPSPMWEMFNAMKIPVTTFYILAKAINEFMPNNPYDWKAILQYFRKEEIMGQQYKIYDREYFVYERSDWGMQDRALEVIAVIKSQKLFEQAMPEVEDNLIKFGLVS